jgi:hypothetical protein
VTTGKDILTSGVDVRGAGWCQSVSCRDVAGRDRDVRVLLDQHDIVIVSPPGEIMRLGTDEARLLRAALTDAENEHRNRWSPRHRHDTGHSEYPT